MFSIKQFLPRVKRYFRENLGAPFILVFQVLLLVCVGLLIGGNSVWAEGLAVVGYFSLVIGIVLQLSSQIISPRIPICRRIRTFPRIRIRIYTRRYFLRHGKTGGRGE